MICKNFVSQNRDENIIAVAQTGMGKTEAGLWWIGNNKGYFVLPLRTAINAIYNRIAYDKDKRIITEKLAERVALLHSSSLSYYMEMKEIEKQEQSELGVDDFDIEAYQKRGQQHSIPLNITTMDQIFDFVFKYQGHELKLVTLSYSKIVIDEIQMYDSRLLAYLIMGIKRICQLGGKVAVLTATLAPFIEDELRKVIPGLKKGKFFDDEKIRHHLLVKEMAINADDILEQFDKNKNNKSGNKILVICNTVKKSQEMYEVLKKTGCLEEDELFLLHAKFTRADRAKKEAAIKDFGKTFVEGSDNKVVDIQNGIWISTSLVEASLDIDFDYLFTELQDLNSLLQRLGRCNRKGAKSVDRPNCIVYTKIDEKALRTQEKNRGFIDYDIFMLSKEALENWAGPISEKEKLDLIAKTFTTEKIKISAYYKEYKRNCRDIESIEEYDMEKDDIKMRDILTEEVIPSPVYNANKEEIYELVKLINSSETDKTRKISLKEKLYAHTVSIESYHIKNYDRARRDNKAMCYEHIKLGKYEEIKVIECQYDEEMGFRPMDFNSPREAVFF